MNQTQHILDTMDLVSKRGLERAGHLLLDASRGVRTDEPFSLARMIRAMSKGGGGLRAIPEGTVLQRLAEAEHRDYDPQRVHVPLGWLDTRAMSSSTGSKGGYSIGNEALPAVDVLRPFSVTARMRMQ